MAPNQDAIPEERLFKVNVKNIAREQEHIYCPQSCGNKSPFVTFWCVEQYIAQSKRKERKVESHVSFSRSHLSLAKGSFSGNDSHDNEKPTDKLLLFNFSKRCNNGNSTTAWDRASGIWAHFCLLWWAPTIEIFYIIHVTEWEDSSFVVLLEHLHNSEPLT